MKSLPAPRLLVERRGLRPFNQPGWIYETKYDGYRLLASVYAGDVRLGTKAGVDASAWFPEVVRGLATLPGGPHILDGEVCVLDELGRADYDRLKARAARAAGRPGPIRLSIASSICSRATAAALSSCPSSSADRRAHSYAPWAKFCEPFARSSPTGHRESITMLNRITI